MGDAGRQRAIVFEEWIIRSANPQRVSKISQTYVLNNALNLSVAEVTHNLLLAGERKSIQTFPNEVRYCFSVCNTILDETIILNGCKISKSTDCSVLLDMQQYSTEIAFLSLAKERRKNCGASVTQSE